MWNVKQKERRDKIFFDKLPVIFFMLLVLQVWKSKVCVTKINEVENKHKYDIIVEKNKDSLPT